MFRLQERESFLCFRDSKKELSRREPKETVIIMFPTKKRRQDDENDGNNDAHLEQRSSIIKPRTRIRALRRQDDDTLSSVNSPGSSAWDGTPGNTNTAAATTAITTTMATDSADFRANCRKALSDNMSIVNTWLRQSLIDHELSQQYKSLEERVRIANAKDGANYIDRPVSQFVDVVAEYHRQQQFLKNLYGCSVPIDVDDNDDDGGGADIVCFGNDENNQIGYPVRRAAIKKSAAIKKKDDDDDSDDDSDGGRVHVVPPHLKEFQHVANIPANASFRFISAGGMHSVAVSMDGNPYTWGSSDDFALGRTCKSKDDNGDARQDLLSISSHLKDELVYEEDLGIVKGFRTYPDGLNEDGTIIQAVAGDSHVLFLTLRGNVYQCGSYKDMDMDSFSDPNDRNSTSVKGGNAKPTHVHRIKRPCIGIYTRGSLNAALLDDYTMVTWGFGNKGDLARSANMTTPLRIENGVEVYDLTKPTYTIHYTDDEGKAASRPDLDVIYEKFLNPLPPIWPRDITSKQDVVSVATGAYHLLVTAREPTSMRSRLFSSGLNNYGQLGLGDLEDRHQLTLVRVLSSIFILQCDFLLAYTYYKFWFLWILEIIALLTMLIC